jgi:hypothetical protein
MEARPGMKMGGAHGLELVKLRFARTNAAWEQLFKITQWNYVALSAAMAISTAGVISTYFEKNPKPILIIVCLFVIIVSTTSAILSYLFMKYVYDLHWHETRIVRAWLKDKDGRDFVDQIHAEPKSPYADRAEGVEFSKDGIADLVTNIYFQINIIPALMGMGLLMAIVIRSL